MEKEKTILIKSSVIDRDVRLPKVIAALKRRGYTVTLLCWDRERKADRSEQPEDYEEIRLRLKAPWGIKILPFLPIWWSFVFFKLMVTRWDIAQAVNFDSIIPTVIAGRLKRKLVIYEILDVYEDEVVLPRAIRTVFLNVDKLFMRLVDAIIVADEAQIEGVGGIPNHKVAPIYDSPPDAYGKEDISYQRSKVFTLFYAGVLYKLKRLNLNRVIKAIEDIEGVKLVIAGYGDLVEEVEELSHHMPDKIEFIGKISYEQVIERSLESDLLFVLRDPVVPANRYTCGSTLFNAMICGKPILASKGTSTASKAYEENCGLAVDANNTEEIKNAIVKLKENPELCEELGANARKAYEQRYSWEIMEQRLIALYKDLLMQS